MADFALAAVILHYGRPEITKRLHRQLMESDPSWLQRIFVLDNHAPQPYPHAWQRLDSNLYWAGALDYCLRFFSSQGWSHVWFMNNDLYFVSPAPHLQRVWSRLQVMEKSIGPVGVYSPSFEQHPYHPQMVAVPGMAYRRAVFVDGVAPLISLDCWRDVGGLDFQDNPYGYGVDVFFSWSAFRGGWPVIVDHEVRVRHVHHSTARTIPGFLKIAASLEQAYLEQRLGPNYHNFLAQAKKDFTDEERL
ncbi:MAG TPA: hypothetical protein ENN39_10285 [Desulfonatronum sp.]|nr:hypothetical protein [Desulfonatronum sp.]